MRRLGRSITAISGVRLAKQYGIHRNRIYKYGLEWFLLLPEEARLELVGWWKKHHCYPTQQKPRIYRRFTRVKENGNANSPRQS